MTFFYDLNKRLSQLAAKQDAKQISEDAKVTAPKSKLAESMDVAEAGYSAKAGRAGKDLGKPGKNFSKIAKGAAERYGSKEAGERVAGAVLNKLRHPKKANEGELGTAIGAGLGGAVGGLPGAALGGVAGHYLSKDDKKQTKEGNAFTGALAKTPKGSKFKVGNKEFTDTSDLEEGFKEMDAWLASREKEKGTGKFDRKERTLPGGMKATTYTRKHEDDVDSDDDETTSSNTPKKKGRPKGKDKGPERVTAKSYKYKAGRPTKTNEGDMEGSHDHDEAGEFGAEGDYVKNELHTMVRVARDLEKHLRDNEDLPTWCIGKLSQSKGMLVSVMDYIISEKERGVEQHTGEEGVTLDVDLDEKAVSQAQRRAAGIAHAAQKGEIPKSKLRGASKEMAKMPKGELHKFAATKEKGLPKHVEEEGKPDFLDLDKDGNKKESMKQAAKQAKEKKVDETTVAGSVATSSAAPKPSKSMQFGKGVYEGLDRQFNQALTESISIESKMSENCDGNMEPGITITADGEEAAKLMMLLKLAGLENQIPTACPTCGGSPCGCAEVVDENSPDWPTNTETNADAFQYSGGLNKPKSTKQGTLTGGGLPTMSPSRQASMEESVELERNLFKTWQNYKG